MTITRSASESRNDIAPHKISYQCKLQCLCTLCVVLFATNRGTDYSVSASVMDQPWLISF